MELGVFLQELEWVLEGSQLEGSEQVAYQQEWESEEEEYQQERVRCQAQNLPNQVMVLLQGLAEDISLEVVALHPELVDLGGLQLACTQGQEANHLNQVMELEPDWEQEQV
ncbi:hypothetical protein FKM82_008438 [Ascaphus truei]